MENPTFTLDIQVRFRDLDPMGHVNNAVYASYLEQARAAFYHESLGLGLDAVDTVLARLEVEYRAPIDLRNEVVVEMDIPRLGESSIPMEYEVLADGELAAVAESVQVVWNREEGGSKPIPDEWRDRIERVAGL